MRLFIAIRFSDDVNRKILSCMHDLKKQGVKGNYEPGSNLHLTLAFIGETDRVSEIRDVMKTVKFQPFRLSFNGYGSFGDVCWLGVKGNQKLQNTVRQLRDGLRARQIPFDDKKFVPHVTIIRKAQISHGCRPPEIKETMLVEKISLMKSVRSGGKTVYSEIFSI
ncbi:MAG: RNA 2',3'-cyclic phosphodiesterase [Bilifractor sp.]|jgi:2'-5' RNA ligase